MIDDDLRGFLAEIDTAYLATASAAGDPYVQHRGGVKGFIRALDDHTLAFLDLAGNRQYLSIGNLAENPRVCLFLMDYERKRRVKVWGTAQVRPLTPEFLVALGTSSRKAHPERAIVITVTRWDVNCPAHIPHKVDAAVVAEVVAGLRAQVTGLRARITTLEAENVRLVDAAKAAC